MLKNIAELLAVQKLESILSGQDCCKCSKCKEDMLAYALNHLTPRYVSTTEGELYSRAQSLSAQYDFEVLRIVAMAVTTVSANPQHEKKHDLKEG